MLSLPSQWRGPWCLPSTIQSLQFIIQPWENLEPFALKQWLQHAENWKEASAQAS